MTRLILAGSGFATVGGLMFSAWFTRRMVAAATPAQSREPDAGQVSEVRMAAAEGAGRRIPEAPVESRVRQPDGPL